MMMEIDQLDKSYYVKIMKDLFTRFIIPRDNDNVFDPYRVSMTETYIINEETNKRTHEKPIILLNYHHNNVDMEYRDYKLSGLYKEDDYRSSTDYWVKFNGVWII